MWRHFLITRYLRGKTENNFTAFPTCLSTAQLKEVMETGMLLCLHNKSRLATSMLYINTLLNAVLCKKKIELHNTV